MPPSNNNQMSFFNQSVIIQEENTDSYSPAFGKNSSPNGHNENLNIINKNPAAASKQMPTVSKINISFMGENSSMGIGPSNSSP